jgi:cysteine-rich repeat protein
VGLARRDAGAQPPRDSQDAEGVPPIPSDAAIIPAFADARVLEASSPEARDGAGTSVCGNRILEPGEDCEDGNLLAGDGCDPGCHYEAWLYGTCGDGKVDVPAESCDDGNRNSGDGCSWDCCIEGCYACTDGCIVAGLRPCHCGNGILERREECDDGNLTPGDGCNQYCGLERPTCGNGVLDKGEQCDDGNRNNGDGCDVACQFDPPRLVCSKAVVCGDGKVMGPETCDDGNSEAQDGCSSSCSVEPGYVCPTPGRPCVHVPAADGGR